MSHKDLLFGSAVSVASVLLLAEATLVEDTDEEEKTASPSHASFDM